MTLFADPGRNISTIPASSSLVKRTYWTGRELELKLLMDKADQGTGGAVVNVVAYQGDYVGGPRGTEVIDATARAKNCDGRRRPAA